MSSGSTMVSDIEIWTYIRNHRGFARFSEVRKALGCSDQRLANGLKRLVKSGDLLRKVGFYKDRPVNEYLAIDLEDHEFKATIFDDHGWLFAIVEWVEGRNSCSISFNLGELGDYLVVTANNAEFQFPYWADRLREAGKLKFKEYSWETGNPAS